MHKDIKIIQICQQNSLGLKQILTCTLAAILKEDILDIQMANWDFFSKTLTEHLLKSSCLSYNLHDS